MLAPWDKSDTNEVVKAALIALATALATEGVKWALERLSDRLKQEAEPQPGSESEK